MSKASVTVLDRLRILQVRGHAVVLASDLAAIYGVATKQLNRAVKRNTNRFPDDFAVELDAEEFANLRFQFGTSSFHGGRRYRPWAFTEHGAIMAATVLNSRQAVAMSLYVVRAFVRLRRELQTRADLEVRLAHIEKTLIAHDGALRGILEKIRPLLLPPLESPKRRIGFHAGSG